ncbi:MAG: hypothetical protein EXQ95_07640 [Alphaproteobacteria bacterium]|nr:hypothetical protein [Alphaproteobacteria bacterium]
MTSPAEVLARADAALAAGDLSAANRLLQPIRAADGTPARLREIGRRLGLDRPAAGPDPAYHLIRAWGAGFWGDMMHVALQLALAESLGRTPIVYWGRESRYRRPGTANAWELYFEPVSAASLDDALKHGLTYFPPKWTGINLRAPRLNKDSGEWSRTSGLYHLNRPENVTVADFYTEPDDIFPWSERWAGADPEAVAAEIYRTRFRLKPYLKMMLDRLELELLDSRPALGIHYRAPAFVKMLEARDKDTVDVAAYVAAIDRYVDANLDAGLYLMTDYAPAEAAFAERYGSRLKRRPVTRLADAGQQSLEYLTELDGRTLAVEVILDVYLAARCDAFLGDGASGVSIAVGRLKDWGPGEITLFRAPGAWPAGFVRQHADPSPWWNPPS